MAVLRGGGAEQMRQSGGKCPREMQQPGGPLQRQTCQIGAQSNTVAEGLPPNPSFLPAMTMPDDCFRFVDELVAGLDHPEEGGKVVSAAGRRPGSQGRVETAD